jgi:hypothetical protein
VNRPRARCRAGWRGQHEDFGKAFQGRLAARRYRLGWSSIEQARRLLAGEGNGLRPVASYLFPEGRDVDGRCESLMIHARAGFAEIGKADPEFQQRWKLMRFVKARRQADLMDGAPKAIAGMRIVMAHFGGSRASRGADEDQSQIVLKLIWEFFHAMDRALVGWVRRSRNPPLRERFTESKRWWVTPSANPPYGLYL